MVYTMSSWQKHRLEEEGFPFEKMEKKVDEILHALSISGFTLAQAHRILEIADDFMLKTADEKRDNRKLSEIGIE